MRVIEREREGGRERERERGGPGAAGAAWAGGADSAGSPFRQLALTHKYGPTRLTHWYIWNDFC